MSVSDIENISWLLLSVLGMFCHHGQYSSLDDGNLTSRKMTFGLKSVFLAIFFLKLLT